MPGGQFHARKRSISLGHHLPLPSPVKQFFLKIKAWLSRLSFKTGVIVLACCIPCYIFSFAQMLLPISATAKGVLWVIFFGLAKTFQYAGISILGVEGYRRIKARITRKRQSQEDSSES